MSYNISLHREDKMTDYIKYRTDWPAPAEWSGIVVNIGNFANKNLYVDNSVELSTGRLNPDWGNYQLATNCNYIKIEWDGKVVIGQITDWQYINDGNVNISYTVDAFMSALLSGFIDEMTGLCERANVRPANRFTNLQSEAFQPSDNQLLNDIASTEFSDQVASFEGIAATPQGISSGNCRYVVTISPILAEYLGVSEWGSIDGLPATKELKVLQGQQLRFNRPNYSVHAGGMYRGVPVVGSTLQSAYAFINGCLDGCGFISKFPASGYSNQAVDTNHNLVTAQNSGGGQAEVQTRTGGEPIESTHFITVDDFYNLYAIPQNFAINTKTFIEGTTVELTTFKHTSNMHSFGSEDSLNGKLTAYPYCYAKLITANGDTVDIIPQMHHIGETPYVDKVKIDLRFIGGDTPRLMGRMRLRNYDYGPYTFGSPQEWFTIRSYPSVTLSIDGTANQQIMRDNENMRKISATYANSSANFRLSNPMSAGYRDAVNGVSDLNSKVSTANPGGGLGGNIGYSFGVLFGTPQGGSGNGQLFKNKPLVELQNAIRDINSGNTTSTTGTYIMGNDFTSQFGLPAGFIYNCGATDAELYAYCRFIEKFGQTLNCTINPLDDSGDIWGGNGQIEPVGDRTYYQFSEIDIVGIMPNEWRENIKNLFESGVYLID